MDQFISSLQAHPYGVDAELAAVLDEYSKLLNMLCEDPNWNHSLFILPALTVQGVDHLQEIGAFLKAFICEINPYSII